MSEEEKENLTEELEESETESSVVSDEDTNETIDESSENTSEDTSEDTTPSNEGSVTAPTPEQVKGYKRNITGLGIALGILILLAALIVVALIVRGMNEDTTCSTDTCEVCKVCTEDTNSRSVSLTYMDTQENK